MKLIKVLTIYDSEPLELMHSLYVLICAVPYFLGGVTLYNNIDNNENITISMIALALFQIFAIQFASLRLRQIGNLLAFAVSLHALSGVEVCLDSCSNMYVLCSPVLFCILWVRNKIELNEAGL